MKLLNKRIRDKYRKEIREILDGDASDYDKLTLLFKKMEKILKLVIVNNLDNLDPQLIDHYFKSDKNYRGASFDISAYKDFILNGNSWSLANSLYLLFSNKYKLYSELFSKKVADSIEPEADQLRRIYKYRNTDSHEDGVIVSQENYERIIWFLGLLVDTDFSPTDDKKPWGLIVSAVLATVLVAGLLLYLSFIYSVNDLKNGFVETLPEPPTIQENITYSSGPDLFLNSILEANQDVFNAINDRTNNFIIAHLEMGKGASVFSTLIQQKTDQVVYAKGEAYQDLTFDSGKTYIIRQTDFRDDHFASKLLSKVETTLSNSDDIQFVLITRCLGIDDMSGGLNRNISSITVQDYHLSILPNRSPEILYSTIDQAYDKYDFRDSGTAPESLLKKIYSSPVLFESASVLKSIVPMIDHLNEEDFYRILFESMANGDKEEEARQKQQLKQFILKYKDSILANESLELEEKATLYYSFNDRIEEVNEYDLISTTGFYKMAQNSSHRIKPAPSGAIYHIINDLSFNDYLIKLWYN